jgi:hypothetical protein
VIDDHIILLEFLRKHPCFRLTRPVFQEIRGFPQKDRTSPLIYRHLWKRTLMFFLKNFENLFGENNKGAAVPCLLDFAAFREP